MVIQGLSQKAPRPGDPGAALDGLRRHLAERVELEVCSLGVLDARQGKLLIFDLSDDEERRGQLIRTISMSEACISACIRERSCVALESGTDGEDRCVMPWEVPVDHGLIVPIVVYGRVVGTINLARTGEKRFSAEEIERVEAAAEVVRRSYEQLIAFSRVGSLIVQEKDLDRICNLFMQALREHALFRRGILTLLDDDLKGYKWFFFGMSDEEIEYFHSHSTNKMSREQRAKIFQEKFRVGNSYYLPTDSDWDYTGVPSWKSEGEMLDWHPDDFLFIPLYGSHKRLVGIVSVDDPADGRAPTAETLSSLELFANQVAHAIEEKKLDSEVKKSTRKYRTLVETMNDGLVVMDMGERITLVNPTLCKLVGYRVEELIGSSLYTFLSDASRALVESKKDERRLGIKSRYEVELVSKDGVAIPVLMSGAPLYEANRLVGSFAVASDLREQKKAEAEFRKMHGEIVDANKKLQDSMERLETTQEQLVQAEKLSAIGELVSGVAHELNNPLTGVIGYAQLLLGRQDAEPLKKQLDTIYKEAIRCQRIVQNLLTFARKHKSEMRAVDINEIVEATLELRGYQLRVDNIQVETRLAPDLPKTMADYHQMQQVFINIINNAHQAMVEHQGKGRLLISTADENGSVVVTFEDDGPGIPDDRIGRIFDPFFTTKDVGKGTGLGLSLSYGIMKEHGGTIEAHNARGSGGAVFRVEVPLRAEKTARDAEPARRPTRRPQTGMRILVVDDEETVLELLTDLLSSRGHRVDTASDGRQALERLRGEEAVFDLVITDMKMPVMGGRELYEAVRGFDPDLAARMLFATGDTVSEDVQAFLRSTGSRIISKPFHLEEMEEIIGDLAGVRDEEGTDEPSNP